MAAVGIPPRPFPGFRRSGWVAPSTTWRRTAVAREGGSLMNGRRIGRLAAAVAVLAILVALPATAGATPHRAGAARTVEHNPKGRFLGVIPAGPAKPRLQDSAGRLDYHNGPVMHGETAYTVFWQPPGTYTSPSYRALINAQIADVAAASYGNKTQSS